MSKTSLLHIPGYVLRWIRERAGWKRPRLARIFEKDREAHGDAASVKSIERLEALPESTPLLVTRYREALTEEVFDELLAEAPAHFPEMRRHDPKNQHEAAERPTTARERVRQAQMRAPVKQVRRAPDKRTKKEGEK